jgi:hypothetical protein
MNTPEARTPDGTIQNQAPPSEPPVTTPPADPVPDTYTFTAPEGKTLDTAAVEAATPIFKELGLTQPQADKLFELYGKLTDGNSSRQLEAVNTMREEWRNAVKSDAEIGGKLDAVKAEIGKSLDLLPSGLRDEFKAAMDLTGAGDHPAFVKAFYKLSQMVNEGKPVTGGGPSTHGQTAPGTGRPSLASAMYPNNP